MQRTLSVAAESFPIAGSFRISRGSKTSADVVTCTIGEGVHHGRGECVPYARYGETIESVRAAIQAIAGVIAAGMNRDKLLSAMPGGAARNAVDCALWDLEAKRAGVPVAKLMGLTSVQALETAYTLSLGSPAEMAAKAAEHAHRPLLKIKLGGDDDIACMRAVALGAPRSRLIVDANEGWSAQTLSENLAEATRLGVALIEQPLPAGQDDALRSVERTVPVCADESFHGGENLARIVGLYDAVNIKLDKTGGLTAAIAARDQARALGFRIMVGCMVGTSLGMAPALFLAQDADFVDLDGPLLLARDRPAALRYEGSIVSPPTPELWG